MPVAVKIAKNITDSGRLDGTPSEAAIMSTLDHSQIVRQIRHKLAGASKGRPSYSEQSRQPEVRLWMVLEFCDKGSLEVRVFGITFYHLMLQYRCIQDQAVYFRCRDPVLQLQPQMGLK